MDEHDEGQVGEAERRKMFADMEAATKRVRTGEADSVDVTVPHGTMRIYRDTESPESIHVDTIGDDAEVTMSACSYPASTVRPAAYPETLPFLAGCTGMVSEAAGGRMRSVMWMKPEDPEAAFGEVVDQVVAMGWKEQPSFPLIAPMGKMRQAVFEREGREGSLRLVLLNEVSQVMWMEAKSKEPREEDED